MHPNEWGMVTPLILGIEFVDVELCEIFNINEFTMDVNDIAHFDNTNDTVNIQFNGIEESMNKFHRSLDELIKDVSVDKIDYNNLAMSTTNELHEIMYEALNKIVRRCIIYEGTVRQIFDILFYKFRLDRIKGYQIYSKHHIQFISDETCVVDLVVKDSLHRTRYIMIEEDLEDALHIARYKLIAYMIDAVFSNHRILEHIPVIGILYSIAKPMFFKLEVPKTMTFEFMNNIFTRMKNDVIYTGNEIYTIKRYNING
ncbi:hypothetical protein BB560_005051, partial [Smittium megazygosporum]